MSDDLVNRLRVEPTASHFLKPAHLYQDLIAERAEAADRIEAQERLIQEMREALRMISGEIPCPDNLMGNSDIAKLVLSKAKSQQEGETE